MVKCRKKPMLKTIAALAWAILLVFTKSSGALEELENDLSRSVVRIVNYSQRGDWYAPWNTQSTEAGAGSGFIVEEGRIMTNAHVVSDAKMILVYLHGDPNPHEATVSVVGHDCDLALLKPLEDGLLDEIAHMEFGELPEIGSKVRTFGYPSGGQRMSSTQGVVSRIEMQRYVHSSLDSHLTVQTDAAINPSNSGGPVVQNGKAVGVAFQGTSHLDNVGFFIPPEIVEHFLIDAADGSYDGFADIGAMLSSGMENPAARRRVGIKENESGQEVFYIFKNSNADGKLLINDVILAIDGFGLANDGTVLTNGHRLNWGVLLDRKQVGENVSLKILRNGDRQELKLPMRAYPPHQRFTNIYDRLPRYFIYAGLVFTPLNLEVLKTYGPDWTSKAEKRLMNEFYFRFLEVPEQLLTEPVVLLRRLEHKINMNLVWSNGKVVEQVNGKHITNLEDLIEAMESNKGEFQVIEFIEEKIPMVLKRAAAEGANKEILETYGVTEDRRL